MSTAARAVLLYAVMALLLVGTGFLQSWVVALTILNLCLISAVMSLGAWDQESVVARLMEMSDEAEVRRILETRLREDAEYRLLAQRMGGSRRAELRAVASTSRAGPRWSWPRSPRAVAP